MILMCVLYTYVRTRKGKHGKKPKRKKGHEAQKGICGKLAIG
jgi:hypothetical protein